eukprot:COSAG04_NODE_1108_length_8231_cov_5.606247_9_plen_45_part_01
MKINTGGRDDLHADVLPGDGEALEVVCAAAALGECRRRGGGWAYT